MSVEESNGVDPEETLAIGISFGNSNSGIAYTTAVRLSRRNIRESQADQYVGG